MSNQHRAYLYAGIAIFFWSTIASAFKIGLQEIDLVQFLFFATWTSFLILLVINIYSGKLRNISGIGIKDLAFAALMGALNPFIYYLVLFKAYDLLPAQEAQPLNYTWAITLAILSIPLLKQKIGLRDFTAAFVSYSGVVVISTHGDILNFRFSSPLGVALALGSTVIWALYWIYNTKDDRDTVVGLLLNFVFGLPLSLAVCLFSSSVWVSSPYGLFGAVYVGIFEMGITFVFWLSALKLSENMAKVGNLIFISPFISLVFIHFFVGEDILVSTYIGLVLIITGLLIQQLKSRRG